MDKLQQQSLQEKDARFITDILDTHGEKLDALVDRSAPQVKQVSAITAINLTAQTIDGEEYAATFNGEVMKPTRVNFTFGNNGTGKSSVAKAIRDDVGVEWASGKSADDYEVLVYDRQFLEDHFANYGYLPGIFTMGEKNVNIQKEIDDNTVKAKEHRDLARIISEKKQTKEAEKDALFPSFYDSFWQIGASIREDFKKVLAGKIGSKKVFAENLRDNKATPKQHDMKALKELYDVAYGGTPETPDTWDSLDISRLERFTNFSLLNTPIVGRNDTKFTRFIKDLNATDWIKRGLDRFVPHTEGMCPFCQQDLPANFEEQIAECFDQQYQEDMAMLQRHRNEYERYMDNLLATLNGNLHKNVYSKFSREQLDLYISKTKTLESKLKLNLQTLDSKFAEPSSEVSIECVVLICDEINNIIAEYNRQVQASKAILADLRNQKRACETQVWEALAFESQSIIVKYRADEKKLSDEIADLTAEINDALKAAKTLETKNVELGKQIVTIKTAVDKINARLRESNFQGFELSVHDGSGQSAYKVIRPHTGKVAKDLSEGERNFIGFLYFYYLVQGSHSDDSISKDKIVVIDDPVSSMDIPAQRIVGSLTQDMLDSCLANKKVGGVQQMFVLTHNVHYHTRVANPLVSCFDVASYFHLQKANNKSTIKLCVNGQENFNPVPSRYVALWNDYKFATTAKELQKRACDILDCYFIEFMGRNGVDLQKFVLETNKEKFIENRPDGTTDNIKLLRATKLLSYIGNNTQASDEDLYCDSSDLDSCRDTFKMIFTVLDKDQYTMMMVQ